MTVRKLAIFVEGQTEQLFVERLINEVAGASRVLIEKRKASGGYKSPRRFQQISAKSVINGQQYFVLLIDCGCDNRVKSDIVDQYESLVNAGYSAIIGLQDVYPSSSLADIERFRTGLRYRVKTMPIIVNFVLSIMEIEAWFLAEYFHMQKIDPRLTTEFVRESLGIDLSKDDIETLVQPSNVLDRVYSLIGQRYKKDKQTVQCTVDFLDYARVFFELPNRLRGIKPLTDALDGFFSAA
jgi:hypothetical protein